LLLFNHIFSITPTSTTQLYTLSLHDALPIFHFSEDARHLQRHLPPQPIGLHDVHRRQESRLPKQVGPRVFYLHLQCAELIVQRQDRKSTRLNSSHVKISYAVFCLKKKNKKKK